MVKKINYPKSLREDGKENKLPYVPQGRW